MKITDLIAKDTKGTDTKNHSKNGLFQERKKAKRISLKTR